ncbi:Lrp/AsnC family transcriptional regulator [Lysinibacillus endophyticus]|uniref:Lrp/AsnC family transcriptional regulator n=1 Tax=Ureibacillus endophyticus TaxID=1978490 RepID=A0A494Z9P4_9BACL|nr:Lrp/AsnC family transcriptional regulator [Lysinibacillus endophyticus]MCP1146045.1 Lrp/AsnC family transcriptional regulator [Lysinibacillus endophyticus]RKQ19330.1 Lrp/AsnC family transcriptional regulator [Lysinibacillus endophyticus]
MKLTAKEMEIVEILEKDSRVAVEDIAKMVALSVEETKESIKRLEENKVIVKYISIVDWTKVEEHPGVRAMIDVKVTPKRGVGFDDIAERIYRFDEVNSVYLMSGTYDLSVIVEAKSMNEVANFVSQKLSTLDSVLSTTTHFILKKYKHDGIIFEPDNKDKRIVVSP